MIELQENRAPLPEQPVEPKPEAPPLVRVDLGCGKRPKEGFDGVDIGEKLDIKYPGIDLFRTPWRTRESWGEMFTNENGVKFSNPGEPLFADNSVDEIHCSHFFEHVPQDRRFAFMDEVHRVLKPGGRAFFICPYGTSRRAIQDPTHQWPGIVEDSFQYFQAWWREANALDHYPVHCDFNVSYAYTYFPGWEGRSPEALAFAQKHYVDVIADIMVNMVKR